MAAWSSFLGSNRWDRGPAGPVGRHGRRSASLASVGADAPVPRLIDGLGPTHSPTGEREVLIIDARRAGDVTPAAEPRRVNP